MVTDRAQTVETDATLVRDGIVVLRANRLCRGVALGPGQHRLRFEYRPKSFQRGLWVSTATLFGILLGGGFTILRRRR